MQEQQPKSERHRQHDADRNVALMQPFAKQAHADPGQRASAP